MTRAQLHDRIVAFRKKWIGKPVDFDGAYGAQCVDLVRMYLKEVHGWSREKIYKAIPPGNALTFFNSASTTYFSKIQKGADNIPREGDIFVMYHGKYGHVGVVKPDCTVTRFRTLDCNWSVPHEVNDEAHGRREMKGWIRVKGITA